MILAAGLGTRLEPYSKHTPKPLFTINRQPILQRIVEQLINSGFDSIMVNTHHLNSRIETFLNGQNYPIPVYSRFEPEILGTGGAIRNISDLWRSNCLFIINADICTDIDFCSVMRTHQVNDCPATMVMHHHPDFNNVWVDSQCNVVSFEPIEQTSIERIPNQWRRMAFTGIHIIDRSVLDFIPAHGYATIIDAYRRLLSAGKKINAFIVQDHYWQDIGTTKGYRSASYDHMAPLAFKIAFGKAPDHAIQCCKLPGDGSQRQWYRLTDGSNSLVMADHDIRSALTQQEPDAFTQIGKHLQSKGVPVPRIILEDCFSGLIFLEDLEDNHLQTEIKNCDNSQKLSLYRKAIDCWRLLATKGLDGFDPSWTYQSSSYDKSLILEKEARYFIEAFVQDYLGLKTSFEQLHNDFEHLADGIAANGIQGLIHRDFQSRNLMVCKDSLYVIDFQGARFGPIQYDLAALLIDPYVCLPRRLQRQLKKYAMDKLGENMKLDESSFLRGYDYCALSRNLQILGAFSFLSRVKGKAVFETYITGAVQMLQVNMAKLEHQLPNLDSLIKKISVKFA
ncbi:MAG: phosphotransferase [Desulfobacteraceae bacterium]|nr:phosphotransferase [Desulfobacteraceae bacterium]